MVYRHESDEDAFEEYPGPTPSAPGPKSTARPGPSPSRFPTPSLPRVSRIAEPDSGPTIGRAAAPTPAPPRPTGAPAHSDPPPYARPEPSVPELPERLAHTQPEQPAYTQPEPPPTRPGPPAYTQPESSAPAPRAWAPVNPEPADAPQVQPARDARRGGGRLWQVLVGGAAVLTLLALCGLGAAAVLMERAGNPQVTPSEPAAPAPTQAERQDLDSRDTDRVPLTAKEVFPGKSVTVGDGAASYSVLKTQSSGSCAVAATGEVADLLVRLGCDQVVRGTLRSPDGAYLLTAGLFNLTDVATAQRVRDRVRELLDERQGRFRGMAAGDGTEALTNAPSRVGWQSRGHYLAYCVVVRADGQPVSGDDTVAREILIDLIDLHLSRTVLERRAIGGSASQPTPENSDHD